MEASRGAAHLRPGLGTDLRGLIGVDRLARRAAAGDERAFAAIFERHHQELYRYCLAILRNAADAEDALQSTMSKALQALPGERREIRLRPWLFRVAHNESIALLRERRPEATTEDFELLGGVEPDEAAERSERLRTLVSDLKSLPDRQRSALLMRELSGLEYAEIATALDCGEGAARQTVYEARAALQTREEGRAMLCEEARRAISDGDRRRLRGRKLRAHLNGCEGCSDFEAAISARRRDLAAIAPPIPAAAAAGLFAGLGGGGATGAGVGALGGGAGTLAGSIFGTAAVKGASVAAAVVIAAGAADATGVIDLPGPFGGSGPSRDASSGSGDSAAGAPAAHGHPAGEHGMPASFRHQGPSGEVAGAAGSSNGGGNGNAPAHSNAGGKSGGSGGHGADTAPGQTGTTPGQSGTTPGGSDTTPGQSGTAPGKSGTAPGKSDTAAPPGQSGTTPGQSGTAPGASGSTPGQSGNTPSAGASAKPESAGKPQAPGLVAAPGQLKQD